MQNYLVADLFWALFNLSPDFHRSITWTLIYFKKGRFVAHEEKQTVSGVFFSQLSSQQKISTADYRLRKCQQAFLYLNTFMMTDPCYQYYSCCWSGLVHSFPPNKLLQHFMLYCFINNIINQTYCNFYCHLVMMLLFFLPAVLQTSAFWK